MIALRSRNQLVKVETVESLTGEMFFILSKNGQFMSLTEDVLKQILAWGQGEGVFL